ncbi:MAG: hypothetical protein H0W63_06575 [Gemmatimonadaceae bacterium]|nr:hypothetical protein [Gemmatimonadaceae bacterium]
MVARRGSSSMGCLFPIFIAALVIYLGKDFVQAYVHNYQYGDAMREEVRFSSTGTDEKIMTRFRALADSLDLPPAAGFIRISHTGEGTVIWSEYDVTIGLPFKHERTLHFHPSSEKSF